MLSIKSITMRDGSWWAKGDMCGDRMLTHIMYRKQEEDYAPAPQYDLYGGDYLLASVNASDVSMVHYD